MINGNRIVQATSHPATVTVSAFTTDPVGGEDNPFRFMGEYFDWERNEVYLRARSYNARTGRFSQPDPFWNIHNKTDSPEAILQSANLFLFAVHNPVMFGDPTGLYRVNLIDYALARGAEVREFVRDGQSMATVSYGETTATYRLNSGMINDYVMNERFGWSSLLTDSQRSWGYGINISDTGGASVRQLGLVHTPVRDSLIAGLAVTPIIRDIVAIHRVGSYLQASQASRANTPQVTQQSNINWRTGENYPRPPGWNNQWQWRYPEGGSNNAHPRWFDPQGGEWRWHAPDNWHPVGHWDHNPWTSWNSPWRNIFP